MKKEIAKVFSGWEFIITFVLMCLISLASAISVISYDYNAHIYSGTNPMLGVSSVYTKWIGNDWNTWSSTLYFFVFPLVACMPGGLSLYREIKTNYNAQMLIRERKEIYYLHKYIAAFISGGSIVCLPVILNIAVVALRFPFRAPDLNYDIFYKIQPFSFGSSMFYEYPWLYLIVRVAVIFVYAGLCAMLSVSISFICKNRYIILFVPQILFMIVNFSNMILRIPYELSPIRFLGAGNTYIVSTSVVFAEVAVLFVFCVVMYVYGSKRDVL